MRREEKRRSKEMENGKQENMAKEHPLYDSCNSRNGGVEKSKSEKGNDQKKKEKGKIR